MKIDDPDNHLDPRLKEWLEKHPYGEQDENGVDLSLIRVALKRSPEERLLRGDNGRHSAVELRTYGRLVKDK